MEIIYRVKVVSDDTGKLAELTASLAEVNKQKDELNKKIKKGEELTAAEKQQFAELTAQQKSYQQEIRKTTQEIEKGVKANKLSSDSLGAMRLKLSEMRAEFEKLNPATAASKKMASEIGNLQKKINDADFSTKNFRGNVGNYQEAMKGAIEETGLLNTKLGGAISTMGSGAIALGAIGVAAAAVSGAVALMNQYWDSTVERQQRAAISTRVINGVMQDFFTSINAEIDKFGTKTGQGFWSQVAVGVGMLTAKYFGANELAEKIWKNQDKRILAQEQLNRLESEEIKWITKRSEIELNIEELRSKAKQKDKFSNDERIAFIEKAITLEKEIATQEFKNAGNRLMVEKSVAKLSDTNLEGTKRLAELEANVNNQRASFYRKTGELEAQRIEAVNAITGVTTKNTAVAKAQTAELQKQYDATQKLIDAEAERATSLKSALDELIAFSQEYDKKQADASKRLLFVNKPEEDSAEIEAIDALSDYEIKKIQETEEGKLAMLKAYQKAGLISQTEYTDKVAEIEQAANAQRVDALGNTLSTMAGLFEEGTTEYKFFASAQAILDTYKAANLALSSAPPPFNFLLMGATIAAGLVNVAKINSTSTKKAADGAYLEGASHAQGGIMIEAEGGEAIINKRSTAKYLPLLSRINTEFGGVPFAERGMYVPTMPDFGGISGAKYQDMLGQQLNDMYSKITQIPVTVLEKDITSTQRRARVAQSQGNA